MPCTSDGQRASKGWRSCGPTVEKEAQSLQVSSTGPAPPDLTSSWRSEGFQIQEVLKILETWNIRYSLESFIIHAHPRGLECSVREVEWKEGVMVKSWWSSGAYIGPQLSMSARLEEEKEGPGPALTFKTPE